MLYKPLGRQGVVHRLIITDAPWPFTGVAELYRAVVIESQFLEVFHFGAGESPLFPEEGSQPPDDPAV